jgi:hypothetical protein
VLSIAWFRRLAQHINQLERRSIEGTLLREDRGQQVAQQLLR